MSYPTNIKAVGINETGGIEVIQNLEVPFPEVKPTDLLVKVHHPSLSSMMATEVHCRSNGLVLTSSIRILGSVTVLGSTPRPTPDFTPRSGLYPSRQRPLPIASEVSGIILELPSDTSVLENSDFKHRGFKKGGRVAIVSSSGTRSSFLYWY